MGTAVVLHAQGQWAYALVPDKLPVALSSERSALDRYVGDALQRLRIAMQEATVPLLWRVEPHRSYAFLDDFGELVDAPPERDQAHKVGATSGHPWPTEFNAQLLADDVTEAITLEVSPVYTVQVPG